MDIALWVPVNDKDGNLIAAIAQIGVIELCATYSPNEDCWRWTISDIGKHVTTFDYEVCEDEGYPSLEDATEAVLNYYNRLMSR